MNRSKNFLAQYFLSDSVIKNTSDKQILHFKSAHGQKAEHLDKV